MSLNSQTPKNAAQFLLLVAASSLALKPLAALVQYSWTHERPSDSAW